MTTLLRFPVVLQVLPSLVTGGVEKGTIEIAQAIVQAGGTALVASSGGGLVNALHRVGGRHVELPLASKNPFTILLNARRLARLIRAERVEVVHARSRAPAWSAWLACRGTGARFVTTYHGAYSEDFPLKRHYNAIMAKGEIVIAASRFIADLVSKRHGVGPERLRTIARGVDPAVFNPALVSRERIERLAAIWRLPKGMRVAMLPGRLTSWKGQSVLIDALARLPLRDVCCVLVGSDQGRQRYSAALREQARSLGIEQRVFPVGQCDDMPAAMMLADVVVHASIQPEAFGRVIVEAQAMGRPVIAAGLGAPVETVQHGVTGWLVRPNDPDALARQLAEVLSLDAIELQAIGVRARATAPTTAAMQSATLCIYRALAARSVVLSRPTSEPSVDA